jgi:diguanylate cyclase (GGDEF)-like protein
MTSITTLRQPDSLRHIEQAAALSLVQAIHRHLDPHALLRVLWSQAASLTQATGMRYSHRSHDLDISLGEGRHSASYTLTHQGEELGGLELRFQRRVDEETLATAEDLLSLAMPALRNALSHYTVCQRVARSEQASGVTSLPAVAPPPVQAAQPIRPAASGASAGAGAFGDDALVLVSLDGFNDIRTAHGDAWAQTLIQTIQSQIHEGLRDADSVFQIDEGLLAVLLPRTNEDAAVDVAGKIRVLISGLHLRDGRVTSQLTACMGVVGARSARTPETVLDQARAALSQAQQEGTSTIRAYRAQTRA